jgi:hypothetical protein
MDYLVDYILRYSEDQPRDDHGRFGEGSHTVETDANGKGVIAPDGSYAGVDEQGWNDWAFESDNINMAAAES